MKKGKKGMMRERIILMASSAFVLAALTFSGIYMRKYNSAKEEEDYLAKWNSLEENTKETIERIAGENTGKITDKNSFNALFENDMDYMPMEESVSEAGSNLVEIGKTTELAAADKMAVAEQAPGENLMAAENQEQMPQMVEEGALGEGELPIQGNIEVNENLPEGEILENNSVLVNQPKGEFGFEEELIWPVNGSVLIPYNMDATVYFKTLDHYSYNPAEIISTVQGANVVACADGWIKEVFDNAVLGQGVIMDLGDGYEAIYGQLCNVKVSEGEFVQKGQSIANIQSPTRFYSLEGCNLYFEIREDGKPVNPEAFIQ